MEARGAGQEKLGSVPWEAQSTFFGGTCSRRPCPETRPETTCWKIFTPATVVPVESWPLPVLVAVLSSHPVHTQEVEHRGTPGAVKAAGGYSFNRD